jgi:hypothetical protein
MTTGFRKLDNFVIFFSPYAKDTLPHGFRAWPNESCRPESMAIKPLPSGLGKLLKPIEADTIPIRFMNIFTTPPSNFERLHCTYGTIEIY